MSQSHQPGSKNVEIISAAVFRLVAKGVTVDFAELVGISSEVENSEYMAAGATGAVFSRHFGRSKPPSVTLKRGLDLNAELWLWHTQVRNMDPAAYRDSTLQLYGPGDDIKSGKARVSYTLSNAWPSKLELSGVKAGATDIVFQTVTLVCDEITDHNAKQ